MRRLAIGIIGVGMVGEPLKRWFVERLGYKRGGDLFCYDTDPKKGYVEDVNRADVVFICVPTPSNPDGSCNTSIVESAVGELKGGKIVVIKSTIPPGTVETLQRLHPNHRILHNPEFLTESQAWEDFVSPDRQIVAPTQRSRQDAVEILNLLPQKNFIRPWSSDYVKKSVNATESELGKYAANVFGYMKVIYGNIIADVCYALQQTLQRRGIAASVDYQNIRELIGADLRIGSAWLNVEHGNYSGAGGYCFPKDMNAFIEFVTSLADDIGKNKRDREAQKILQKGVAVLEAVRAYNRALLAWQGLTEEEVSRHNHELIMNKRKPIRITEKRKKSASKSWINKKSRRRKSGGK